MKFVTILALSLALPLKAETVTSTGSLESQLSACTGEKSRDLAKSIASVPQGTDCNCQKAGSAVPANTKQILQVALHQEVINQSLINSLDKLYELESRFGSASPLEVLKKLCKNGCDKPTLALLKARLRHIQKTRLPSLSKDEAAATLNRQIQSINTKLVYLLSAKGKQREKGGNEQELEQKYREYVWSFYNLNGGILSTQASQKAIGSIKDREVRGNLSRIIFQSDRLHNENAIKANQIDSLVNETRGSIQAEFDRVRKMKSNAKMADAAFGDLKELALTNPTAIGQVLGRHPNLTAAICPVLAEAQFDMDEARWKRNMALVVGAAAGVAVFAPMLAAGAIAMAPQAAPLLGMLASGKVATAMVGVGTFAGTAAGVYGGNLSYQTDAEAKTRQGALLSGSGDARTAAEQAELANVTGQLWTDAKLTALGLGTGDIGAVMNAAKIMGVTKVASTSRKAAVAGKNLLRSFLKKLNVMEQYGSQRMAQTLAQLRKVYGTTGNGEEATSEIVKIVTAYGEPKALKKLWPRLKQLSDEALSGSQVARQRLDKFWQDLKTYGSDCAVATMASLPSCQIIL